MTNSVIGTGSYPLLSTTQKFVPNDVPCVDPDHYALVQSLREDISDLARTAYPIAPKLGAKDSRPRLDLSRDTLKAWLYEILNPEVVKTLIKYEREMRPAFEDASLKTAFETLLPIAMGKLPGSTLLQYSVIVNSRCIDGLADAHFTSGAGFMEEHEVQIGKPRSIEDIVRGGWKEIAITDAKILGNEPLRKQLTPTCSEHRYSDVVQLAFVHRFAPAKPESARQKTKSQDLPELPQSLPIFEARLKTTFEYLWKYVQYLQGYKEDIPDAFAALVRTAGDRELAQATIHMLMRSPAIWNGSIKPQNWTQETFTSYMKEQLKGSNGDWKFYQSRLEPNVIPQTRNLKTKHKGDKRDAQYIEVLIPTGSSNKLSFLGYTDFEYGKINGNNSPEHEQNRLGYQRRRENDKRETSTLLDWLIAKRLADLSLDPQSVAYNNLMVHARLADVLGLVTPKAIVRKYGFS